MSLELPEGYRVVWKHYRIRKWYWVVDSVQSCHIRKIAEPYSPSAHDSNFDPTTHGGRTECFIYGPDRQLVATGEALCSLKDQFVYKIGRQISLGRALKQLQGKS